jgi:hypothetical protein
LPKINHVSGACKLSKLYSFEGTLEVCSAIHLMNGRFALRGINIINEQLEGKWQLSQP